MRLVILFIFIFFLTLASAAENNTSGERPRTHLIKTAPEVILLIGASIMLVGTLLSGIWIIVAIRRLHGISLYLLMYSFVAVAMYMTLVGYFLTSQNQLVYERQDKVAVMVPILVLNVLLWMVAVFACCRFLRLHAAIQTLVEVLALLGLVVQCIASFSFGAIQWVVYVVGLVPLLMIPVLLYTKQERDSERKWSDVHTIISVLYMIFLYLVFMVTALSGHSFGGAYGGLGASDEIALQIVQHALLAVFLIYMAWKTMPPKTRLNQMATTTKFLDEEQQHHPD